MKRIIIHTRVDETERQKIEQMASRHGCTVSEYIRDAALQNPSQSSSQLCKQRFYTQLCEIVKLIEQIDDPTLQAEFKDWRHETWQAIR